MRVESNAHWRDSARPLRFFIWDGHCVYPMVIFLVHMRLWTFILAFSAVLFFSILNRFGFTPVIFFRWIRSKTAGPVKVAEPWWMK